MTWQPSPETKNLCGVQKRYILYIIHILYILYIYIYLFIYLFLYPISLHHSAYYFVAYVLLNTVLKIIEERWCHTKDNSCKAVKITSLESICLNATCPCLGCRHLLVRQAIWRIAINHAGEVSNPAYTHIHRSYMLEAIYRHCLQRCICWFAYWLPHVDFMPIISSLRLQGNSQKHSAHASSHCEQRHRRCHGQRKRRKRGQEDQTQAVQTEALTKRQAPIDTTRWGYCNVLQPPVATCSVPIQVDNKPWFLGSMYRAFTGSNILRLIITYSNHPADRNLWGTKVLAIRTSLQSSQGASLVDFNVLNRFALCRVALLAASSWCVCWMHCCAVLSLLSVFPRWEVVVAISLGSRVAEAGSQEQSRLVKHYVTFSYFLLKVPKTSHEETRCIWLIVVHLLAINQCCLVLTWILPL